MNDLPLHAITQCVAKHMDHHKAKDITWLDQFIAMTFAQLTYRESLRDIEMNLKKVNPIQYNKVIIINFHHITLVL